MKNGIIIITIVALILVIGSGTILGTEKDDYKKARKLYKEGKMEEALKAIAEGMTKYPESDNWPKAKYAILMEQKKYDQALEAAKLKYKLAKHKSPGKCLDITDVYLKLKNKEGALKWIEEAVKLKYKKYYRFDNEEYELLKGDKRFDELIAKMKENVGFGKPPKDFTITSLNGESLTLSKMKGKVVLIDFWATWCSPCVKEIPNLKKAYEQFKDKGFEIIGISMDFDKKRLETFIKKENVQWPISWSGKGWKDETRELYGVTSIPSMWLVDKKGVLRGFDLKGEELQKEVAKLLAE
jgi:peroxiredoxin